jgi:hypothetical protein
LAAIVKKCGSAQSISVDLSSTCHSRLAANNPIETEMRKGWSALSLGHTDGLTNRSLNDRVDREQNEHAENCF